VKKIGNIGSPPSYRRYSSPKPPNLVLKGNAGILRIEGGGEIFLVLEKNFLES